MIAEFFSDKTHQLFALVAGFVLICIIMSVIAHFTKKKSKNKMMREATEYTLLQISQTAHTESPGSKIEEVQLFEELLSSIITEKKPITFEIAVPNDRTDILFFIAVPPEYVETVRNQVRRVFERAQVQEVSDYTIFSKNGSTILANASLKQFYGLPIRSYKKSGSDSFAAIVGAFAAAKEQNTGMAMQVILQKAPKNAVSEIKHVIKQMKAGKKLKHIKPGSAGDRISGAVTSITDGNSEKKDGAGDSEIQMLEEKSQELLYRANIRIGVCAETEEQAGLLFDNLCQRFEQFGTSGYNSFIFNKRTDKRMALDFSFRLGNQGTAVVMSAEEISSIFHIFNQSIEVSNMQWEKTKRVAAPTNIATEGILLGDNVFHGQKTAIYMPEKDRMRHIYIIGQTGTGKTAIIKSLTYQDIQNNKGVCIIDPHGDLVDDMLAVVPEHRLDDVIVFDPSDTKNSLAINMLEYDRNRPEEKTFIIDEILSIFYSLFSAETMGPMFEQYLRNSLLLLMEGKVHEPATLLEVPRVLTDESFRTLLLQNCSIDAVKRFWQEEAEKVEGEASLSNIAPYITSKFANFISNDYIRPIISQPHSSFSFREVMDSGKLLFVKLSQGKIGKINAGLMGMIATGKIALAAFARDDIPESQRRAFYLYIDEFQNFTTDSISKILSEARKYRLSLNIAHQFMAQLTDDIRSAVLGNVGTTISFRIGIEDAQVLEKKFAPKFSALELAETENLNCVVGMLSHDTPLSPFTMQIRFAPRGSEEVKHRVARYATLKHNKNAGSESAQHQEMVPAPAKKQTVPADNAAVRPKSAVNDSVSHDKDTEKQSNTSAEQDAGWPSMPTPPSFLKQSRSTSGQTDGSTRQPISSDTA